MALMLLPDFELEPWMIGSLLMPMNVVRFRRFRGWANCHRTPSDKDYGGRDDIARSRVKIMIDRSRAKIMIGCAEYMHLQNFASDSPMIVTRLRLKGDQIRGAK